MTDTTIDVAPQVPEPSTSEKFLRFAKAHVAVLGAVLLFAEQNAPVSAGVKHWLAFAIGLGAAAGVWLVPNAPSETQRLVQANAMAVQAQNPPEDHSVDVSAPVAPVSLEDVQDPQDYQPKHQQGGSTAAPGPSSPEPL